MSLGSTSHPGGPGPDELMPSRYALRVGGVKASGRAREGGAWGIEEFLEAKVISGWAED
ncbi:acyl-CoA reductase-like NAD-dependent aldehyde dehydrogenase [Mycoplana sp. BE70]|uniref:hypothetical protein n=1 Tax=Mycoplana sp. BE70 TaxID=2817775 RepID=UPI00285E4B94|nr:hypothetical protein [Mycoplana sp. BE70]MDR6758102.1 acyl-CoA reductase-like NAD-dependent aldehyde dehydrogenase [Mycoplana sp. BE70]